MNKLIALLILTLASASTYSYISVSDEIDDMISSFDLCSDSENSDVFYKMYDELKASEENNDEIPFYVDISRYIITFESETNSCDVYVDPYDWRCFTTVCQ